MDELDITVVKKEKPTLTGMFNPVLFIKKLEPHEVTVVSVSNYKQCIWTGVYNVDIVSLDVKPNIPESQFYYLLQEKLGEKSDLFCATVTLLKY